VIDYVQLTPGRPGFKPTRAALYYSQRLVVQRTLRSAVSACIARGISWAHPKRRVLEHTRDQEAACREILASLDADGIAILPKISSAKTDDIRNYLAGKDVLLRDGTRCTRDQVPAESTIADYPLDTVLNCPHLLALANAPLNIRIATEYFGCLPTISTVGIRWSFPGNKKQVTTQGFHRDTDDWRCLKYFIYLTDVDPGCGPHLYVRRSQRTPTPLFNRPITSEFVEQTFGADGITSVLGACGTAFMGDMHGIHAGPIPARTPRLMLEVGYTILPVYALRYEPAAINLGLDIDKYINRLLVK
jgi:hypothetical protein